MVHLHQSAWATVHTSATSLTIRAEWQASEPNGCWHESNSDRQLWPQLEPRPITKTTCTVDALKCHGGDHRSKVNFCKFMLFISRFGPLIAGLLCASICCCCCCCCWLLVVVLVGCCSCWLLVVVLVGCCSCWLLVVGCWLWLLLLLLLLLVVVGCCCCCCCCWLVVVVVGCWLLLLLLVVGCCCCCCCCWWLLLLLLFGVSFPTILYINPFSKLDSFYPWKLRPWLVQLANHSVSIGCLVILKWNIFSDSFSSKRISTPGLLWPGSSKPSTSIQREIGSPTLPLWQNSVFVTARAPHFVPFSVEAVNKGLVWELRIPKQNRFTAPPTTGTCGSHELYRPSGVSVVLFIFSNNVEPEKTRCLIRQAHKTNDFVATNNWMRINYK